LFRYINKLEGVRSPQSQHVAVQLDPEDQPFDDPRIAQLPARYFGDEITLYWGRVDDFPRTHHVNGSKLNTGHDRRGAQSRRCARRAGQSGRRPRAFRPGENLTIVKPTTLLDLLPIERGYCAACLSLPARPRCLQASLMRLLSEEGLHVLPVARVKWRAGDTPAMSATRNPYLYSVMVDLARGQDGVPPAPLLDTGDDLEAFLTRGMGTPSDELQVLIFDQFEELLTVDSTDTAGKHAFCRELGRVLQSKSRFAVFAMRDEYLGALEPYLGHFSTRLAARYRLDFLRVGEAHE
jgi:hypothetical protein